VFRVSDTGQGMTQEQTARLFTEYTRFYTEANRTIEGTGLGLNITKNLVRMMDGEISVESEPGKGSTFTVRLPQRLVNSDVLGKELTESFKQFHFNKKTQLKKMSQIKREYLPYGRVLVVDDVETNLYVARGLMAPYGLSIDTAASGLDAIDRIKRGDSHDIVFMDHFMPEMDGIEATKIIRGLGYTRPIVALTANAVAGQVEMFMANGFDDFISKPIDIRQLNTILNKLVRDRYPAETIEIARRLKENMDSHSATGTSQGVVAPQLTDIFIRDAEKAIAVLQSYETRNSYGSDDLQMYIVNIHGLKSALANIGETKLSGIAKELEQAGRDRNTGLMAKETPELINALKSLITKLKPAEEDNDLEISEEDSGFLHDKLLEIKEACTMFDSDSVETALNDLRQKKRPNHIKSVFDDIEMHILHSDFDEAVAVCTDYFSDMETNKL
jgi:CheY-like chemotaxis protein